MMQSLYDVWFGQPGYGQYLSDLAASDTVARRIWGHLPVWFISGGNVTRNVATTRSYFAK